jgi:hypothetical protein
MDALGVAAKTLRKADKIPEYKELLAAMDTIRELQRDLSKSEQKISELETELAKKLEIEGPTPPFGYFFNPQHPNSPICPKCYQSKTPTISFVTDPYEWSGGIRRDCRICSLHVYEKAMGSSQRQNQVRGSRWS